jgi:hypothetical protein
LLVERERVKGRRRIYSLLHPCKRALEWNSLCFLVEGERNKER